MGGLYLLFPTLMAVFISLLVVRAGAIALMLTGMDLDRAKFQALSAFSGTGFTTHEAESVVNHPTRRKIISLLMIAGNAGIVTVIITATSSFALTTGFHLSINATVLLVGLAVIYSIARHTKFLNHWGEMVQRWLPHSFIFQKEALEEILPFAGGFGLVKLIIDQHSSLNGQDLSMDVLNLQEECILGVRRNEEWKDAKTMPNPLQAGDGIVIYGRISSLKKNLEDTQK